MSAEIWLCPKCGREFDVYYSIRDECEIVSGSCKCSLQIQKTKVLDQALLKLKGVLNEKHQPSVSKVSIATKTSK